MVKKKATDSLVPIHGIGRAELSVEDRNLVPIGLGWAGYLVS